MASLPLMSWRLTESTRPASTSGSILFGIFKGAFCAVSARPQPRTASDTDLRAGGRNLQQTGETVSCPPRAPPTGAQDSPLAFRRERNETFPDTGGTP